MKGDSKKKGIPQVLQLLGGFHQEGELAGVIAPLRDPTQIQGNDRGPIEPRGKSAKINVVISAEIQVNQIGEGHCERQKWILVDRN